MRSVNLPSGAERNSEVGMVWREVFNGAGAFSFRVLPQQTFRVSSAGDVTVTIDGVLAMTLRNGEVERFCAGSGAPGDTRTTILVQIGTGGARVQVAEVVDPGRRTR
jgi:hypothetical protein